MPESKVRVDAKKKKQAKQAKELNELRSDKSALSGAGRSWVPWVFVPLGLLGVLWMVVYQLAGNSIGFMRAIGDWNVLIGLGMVVASFGLMTLWK